MSIDTVAPLSISIVDAQFTHRGVTLAVQTVAYTFDPLVLLCEKKSSGEWEGVAILAEWDDTTRPETDLAKHGSAETFVRNVLVPKINAYLEKRFLPISVPPETEPDYSGALVAIDAAIDKLLKWQPQSDGTLRVTA